MKVAVVFIILVLVQSLTFDPQDQIAESIKEIESSKLGSAILSMAALNYKLQGPIDELLETIKGFGRSLIVINISIQERAEEENLDFEAISAESSSKQKILSTIISDAEVGQTAQRKKIAQEFQPRIAEIEAELLRIKNENSQNESQLKMQDVLRRQQNAQFVKSTQEQGELVEVVDECLKYIGALLPRSDASLIEMDKVQLDQQQQKDLSRRLRSIKNRLEGQNGDKFVEFVSVLNDPNSFKQRHFIKAVIDLLNKLRRALVASQGELLANEQESARAYEQWVAAQSQEDSVFANEYDDLLQERADLKSFISDCENIIKIYEADIETFTERVNLEKKNLLISKETHEHLSKQINTELDIIQKAIKLLLNPAIFEYLKYKINLGA